jgi:hypothetical protein
MWFRIFGRGLMIRNITKYELPLSERNGYSKSILIGKWLIIYLPKVY